MRLEWLQLFAAVAKHLNVTKASAEHHVSQPAVSKQLRLFQESIGVTLLRRQGRGIALTKAGTEVLKDVQGILDQVEHFQEKYTRRQPTVSIAVGRGLSGFSLPSLMASFIACHRSVEVNLFWASSVEIWQWLENSTIDFAILNSPPHCSGYSAECLRTEQMIAFVAPMHFLAVMGNGGAMHEMSLIVRSGRPGQTRTEEQVAELKKGGRRIRIAMRCGSAKAVREAVAQGAGIGILYHDAINREIENGEFEPVEVPGLDLRRASYIVYSKQKRLSLLAQEFLVLLRGNKNEHVAIPAAVERSGMRRRSRMRERIATLALLLDCLHVTL